MQGQTNRRASVIMLRGHGEDRIRQAIQQGLVAKDLQDDVEKVLKDITKARFDLDVANKLLEDERKSYIRFEKLYYEALKAKNREDKRKQKYSDIKMAALFFGVMFIVVLLCMMICRAIFG